MSLYGISDKQLESLMYPNGRGQMNYGGTPIFVNQTGQALNGVQPSGVSMIGSAPVQTGVVAATDPNLGVTAGQTAATGIPAGAAMGGATGGAGGFASIASGAISQIADVAANYAKAKGAADALKSQQAIPGIPQDDPNTPPGIFQPPALAF